MRYKFYQYPRGVNKGGVLNTEICPTISCSSWENNCFLIEIEECNTKENILTPTKVSTGTQHKSSFEDNLGGISRTVKTDDSLAIMEEIQEPQVARMCSRNPENPSDRGKSNGRFVQMLELKHDGTSNTLTSVQKDNLVVEQSRYRIRKLTPRECFRLMDVDENVIDSIQAAGISNSLQYKLAGNSIVVACLEKIFEQMFFPQYTNSRTLFG